MKELFYIISIDLKPFFGTFKSLYLFIISLKFGIFLIIIEIIIIVIEAFHHFFSMFLPKHIGFLYFIRHFSLFLYSFIISEKFRISKTFGDMKHCLL